MLMDLGLVIICTTPICLCICYTIYKCFELKYKNKEKEEK